MEQVDPEALGFDGERLARVPAFIERTYVETGRLAGAQLLVARKGHVVHFS